MEGHPDPGSAAGSSAAVGKPVKTHQSKKRVKKPAKAASPTDSLTADASNPTTAIPLRVRRKSVFEQMESNFAKTGTV